MSAYQVNKKKKEKQKNVRVIKVNVPTNIPLDKAPWDSYVDALARAEISAAYIKAKENAGSDAERIKQAEKILTDPYEVRIIQTESGKAHHLD